MSFIQHIAGHTAKVRGSIVKIDGEQYLPLSICGLGAGKDAWMRGIFAPCAECKQPTRADQLNEGGYCETCIESLAN